LLDRQRENYQKRTNTSPCAARINWQLDNHFFMAFILTNDDGIDAPGIRALQKAINGKGIIVAPATEWSGCGHRVTTTQPINVERRIATSI